MGGSIERLWPIVFENLEMGEYTPTSPATLYEHDLLYRAINTRKMLEH